VLEQILASEELVAEVERVDARVEGLRSIGDDPSKEREPVWGGSGRRRAKGIRRLCERVSPHWASP
jgi:hypothetical protein